MKIRLAAPLQGDSIVDGEGIRAVVWTQGCSHNCFACQNPQTHDFKGGYEEDIENIKNDISSLVLEDGITFSGGDPMFQAKACSEIAEFAKEQGLNIWCYTGFTFEKLLEMKNKDVSKFLDNIDVLVDGKFELEHRSFECMYRGSTNQRLIDVQKSLKENRVVTITKYDEKEIIKPQRKRVFV